MKNSSRYTSLFGKKYDTIKVVLNLLYIYIVVAHNNSYDDLASNASIKGDNGTLAGKKFADVFKIHRMSEIPETAGTSCAGTDCAIGCSCASGWTQTSATENPGYITVTTKDSFAYTNGVKNEPNNPKPVSCMMASGCPESEGYYSDRPNSEYFKFTTSSVGDKTCYKATQCNEDNGYFDKKYGTGSQAYHGYKCYKADYYFLDVYYEKSGTDIKASCKIGLYNYDKPITLTKTQSTNDYSVTNASLTCPAGVTNPTKVKVGTANNINTFADGVSYKFIDESGQTVTLMNEDRYNIVYTPNGVFTLRIHTEQAGSDSKCPEDQGYYEDRPTNSAYFSYSTTALNGTTCYSANCASGTYDIGDLPGDFDYFANVKGYATYHGKTCLKVECKNPENTINEYAFEYMVRDFGTFECAIATGCNAESQTEDYCKKETLTQNGISCSYGIVPTKIYVHEAYANSNTGTPGFQLSIKGAYPITVDIYGQSYTLANNGTITSILEKKNENISIKGELVNGGTWVNGSNTTWVSNPHCAFFSQSIPDPGGRPGYNYLLDGYISLYKLDCKDIYRKENKTCCFEYDENGNAINPSISYKTRASCCSRFKGYTGCDSSGNPY